MRRTAFLHRPRLLLGIAGLLAISTLTFFIFWERKKPQDNPQPAVLWVFEQAQRGAIISTPAVTPECVFVAAIRDNALAPSGVVYGLDRRKGTIRWQFDNDGEMLHTISSPCVKDGRLYIGEGMHGNDVCKFYCLDAASGRKLWHVETGGHIESSPCVAAGVVVFGSGDDGLYALDAVTSSKRWQFNDHRHIDVSPAIADGYVYAGSGVSERNRATEIFCLRLTDGKVLWRKPTELPVWGSPVVNGGQVFFGTGNGRLTQSAEPPEKPAGCLICADAITGDINWTCPVADGVFARCRVDAQRVYFGARDGRCYGLDRRGGRRVWQYDLGQPIVTQPALLDGRLYVLASGGRFCCLDADTGQPLWTFDLAGHTQSRPQLLASPIVLPEGADQETSPLIYLGMELRNAVQGSAVLYCLRDESMRGRRP